MLEGSNDRPALGPYFLAFGVCLALLTIRAWGRLNHLELWAEDGMVFLPEALESGWRSLALPNAGLYGIIPRALIVTWTLVLPPGSWSAAITISAIAMMAAVLAIPAGRSLAWIIPDIRARFLLCLILCLAPGLNEMIGNYANLPWFFFFAVAFFGLRDPSEPIPAWAVLLSLFLITSMGQALFAIPLFVWRTLESITKRRSRAHIWSSAAVLGALCVSVWALWLARESQILQLPQAPPDTLFLAFVKTTGDSLLLLPLVGDRLAIALSGLSTPWPRVAVLTAAFALLAAGLVRLRRRPQTLPIVLFTAGVLCWPVVSWLARPGNLNPFVIPLDDWATRHRYAFPSAFTAFLVWMFLLQASRWTRWWKAGLSLMLLMASLGVGSDRFWISAYGAELKWDRMVWFIERARTTGCPNPIVGSIYPGRWTFTYEDKRRPRCDPK